VIGFGFRIFLKMILPNIGILFIQKEIYHLARISWRYHQCLHITNRRTARKTHN